MFGGMSVYKSTKPFAYSTMPDKSLGTLAMIYAIVELQIPSPVKQCCGKEI